ncbi:PWI domain-containing protein [Dipodascopsis tothii]|uniref:PWI domain-containing protein n=1 Tax=Dipodascopsis tothii TaxID=44089 RepID=UPI0034CFEFBD
MSRAPEFGRRVDLRRVNLPVLRLWLVPRLAALLQDDDVTLAYAVSLVDGSNTPDIRSIESHLEPLFPPDAPVTAAEFCLELWRMLLAAQESPRGIAPAQIEAKRAELKAARAARAATTRPPPWR